MNENKKNPKDKRAVLMGVAVVALVIVVAVLGLEIAGNRENNPAQPSGTTVQPDADKATLPSGGADASDATLPDMTQPEDLVIETPYGVLPFPGEWEPFLSVEQTGDPLQVRFSALLENGTVQPLFTITFGALDETTAGMLERADGSRVAVNVSVAQIVPGKDWTDSDEAIVWAMQEELNHILAALPLTDPSPDPATQTEPPAEDVVIGTPYCELRYPSEWQKYLSLKIDETNGYSVSFYCALDGREPEHLFTVHLGGDQGVSVMELEADSGETVELRLTISEFAPDGSWSDEEKSIVYAMQEEVNYLLGSLSE